MASVGRRQEGEAAYRAGLAIHGISDASRHLPLFELALQHAARGDLTRALALAREASALVPEHHRPWQFVAELHRRAGSPNEAADAERSVEALCSTETRRLVAGR